MEKTLKTKPDSRKSAGQDRFTLQVLCPHGHGLVEVGGMTRKVLRLDCGCWLHYVGGPSAFWQTLSLGDCEIES